jgi:hypothetical protein
VAMAPARGKKEDCEVSEARALLADDRVQLANSLPAIIPFKQEEPLSAFFDFYHRHRREALNLILNSRPIL